MGVAQGVPPEFGDEHADATTNAGHVL